MNAIKSVLLSLVLALASFTAIAAEPVDINRADAAQLATLNGVGPAKAEAIVAYREKNGPFQSVDQLAEVKGIGLKTVDKNRDMLRIGGASKAPAKPAGTP
jgi:competence protein ComEA